MSDIRNIVRKNREEETLASLENNINKLQEEGFKVEFGNIGAKTTYALIYNDDHSIEYVGYTFVRDTRYYNENIGKLKALVQAMSRRESLSEQ